MTTSEDYNEDDYYYDLNDPWTLAQDKFKDSPDYDVWLEEQDERRQARRDYLEDQAERFQRLHGGDEW